MPKPNGTGQSGDELPVVARADENGHALQRDCLKQAVHSAMPQRVNDWLVRFQNPLRLRLPLAPFYLPGGTNETQRLSGQIG